MSNDKNELPCPAEFTSSLIAEVNEVISKGTSGRSQWLLTKQESELQALWKEKEFLAFLREDTIEAEGFVLYKKSRFPMSLWRRGNKMIRLIRKHRKALAQLGFEIREVNYGIVGIHLTGVKRVDPVYAVL